MIKSRFSPSPTGFLHLGNVRTALFSYLFAQNREGVFLLRIEDTDAARSQEQYDHALQNDLHWLNLDWQEGPYYQSQRQDIYNDYYQRLQIAQQAYPCFCSEEQLKLSRKVQLSAGKPPRYAGTCRALTEEEIQKKCEQGLKPTLRFRVPDQGTVKFTDLIRGEQIFRCTDLGDFIIRRADGTAPFLFCNAVDDALMNITHVLRGEDHLTNTPRQILLLETLGFSMPTYGHIALIVGPDHQPLSKRHGSRSVTELRALGYLPLALNNYLARLGHVYKEDQLMSLKELAAQFDVDHLVKSAAQFNQQQMDYWQKCTVAQLSTEDFLSWGNASVNVTIPEDQKSLFVETVRPNVLFPADVAMWASICFGNLGSWDDAQKQILRAAGARYFDIAMQAFRDLGRNNLAAVIQQVQNTLGVQGKALHQPLRVALTAQAHGPAMAPLLALITEETIQQRLQAAKHVCDENF